MRWSEVSPDTTHDWFPDNVTDGGDTFIEIQAIAVTLNLDGWTVRVLDGSSVELASLELGSEAITKAGGYYVVFGHDLGVTIPGTGTVQFLNPAGTAIVSRSWSGVTGSSQWDESTYSTAYLSTPGQAYDYWTAHPTPTAIP